MCVSFWTCLSTESDVFMMIWSYILPLCSSYVEWTETTRALFHYISFSFAISSWNTIFSRDVEDHYARSFIKNVNPNDSLQRPNLTKQARYCFDSTVLHRPSVTFLQTGLIMRRCPKLSACTGYLPSELKVIWEAMAFACSQYGDLLWHNPRPFLEYRKK